MLGSLIHTTRMRTLLLAFILTHLFFPALAQIECAKLDYSKLVISQLDELENEASTRDLSELKICVDSLTCESAAIVAMYAHDHNAKELLFLCMAQLIECGGLFPDDLASDNLVLKSAIHGPDSARFHQAFDSLYPIFLSHNYMRLEAIYSINRMRTLDQVRRVLEPPFTMGTIASHTPHDVARILARVDSANFLLLMELCMKYGELPLSDRYGWATTGVLTTLLLHIGQGPHANQRWKTVWPYIVDAMNNCRVGDRFLAIYDRCYYNAHGVQWFGTMSHVPCLPEDVPGQRRTNRSIE
jgi:hypothetical protein